MQSQQNRRTKQSIRKLKNDSLIIIDRLKELELEVFIRENKPFEQAVRLSEDNKLIRENELNYLCEYEVVQILNKKIEQLIQYEKKVLNRIEQLKKQKQQLHKSQTSISNRYQHLGWEF